MHQTEVWGYENLTILERIHTEFVRKLFKIRKSTPLYMIYADNINIMLNLPNFHSKQTK